MVILALLVFRLCVTDWGSILETDSQQTARRENSLLHPSVNRY